MAIRLRDGGYETNKTLDITITLSPEHHVLVATNYSASEYPPFRGFLNVGDIHSCEPWLYSECLQRNIKVRAKEWRKIHQLGRSTSGTRRPHGV